MTPIEKLKEELMEVIESRLGSKANGTTVNFHSPEGGGSSSCAIEKQKDGAKVTVKAYSSDLDKLEATVTTAIEQYNRAMNDLKEEAVD